MSLPPYLTSGASSRAHHALIVSLNGCSSAQEEDAVARAELARAKAVVVSKQSTAKISETLIIVLHCYMALTAPVDLEWALIPALQLAEGGKTLHERRIGYLFLCERLPPEHELGLMLINTIRKDLSSSTPHDILLALNTIVHLPSTDLLPAVQPILCSKVLLRHDIPSIRQKTLVALSSLHFARNGDLSRTVGPSTFPLSLGKMVKLLGRETEISVVHAILRLLEQTITSKVHTVQDGEERTFLVETIIAQSKRANGGTSTTLIAMKIVRLIYKRDCRSSETALRWVSSVVSSKRSGQAVLLAACDFAALDSTWVVSPVVPAILRRVSALFAPGASTSTASTQPAPNDHLLALRCLTVMPPSTWDGQLGASQMRAIMEGLNSPDDSIRTSTLRLLHRLSPQLLTAALDNHLKDLSSATDLALPLNLPDRLDPKAKLRFGQDETAGRALEVVHVQTRAEQQDAEAGRVLARGISRIAGSLDSADRDEGVWEQGLRSAVEWMRDASSICRNSFIHALFDIDAGAGQTVAALRAILAAEYGEFAEADEEAIIEALMKDITVHPASIQELSLVAAVGILSRSSSSPRSRTRQVVHEASRKVGASAGGYMRKRCQQIQQLLSDTRLLIELHKAAKSRSVRDLLEALISLTKPALPPTTASSPPAASRSLVGSALRYDAYAPPTSVNPASRSVSRSRPALSPTRSSRDVGSPRTLSAGEYALFSADEHDLSETSALLDDERVDNLVGLTLGEARPSGPQRRISDPFRNDSDEPSTPRMRAT